jgi:hypothetical protein
VALQQQFEFATKTDFLEAVTARQKIALKGLRIRLSERLNKEVMASAMDADILLAKPSPFSELILDKLPP